MYMYGIIYVTAYMEREIKWKNKRENKTAYVIISITIYRYIDITTIDNIVTAIFIFMNRRMDGYGYGRLLYYGPDRVICYR